MKHINTNKIWNNFDVPSMVQFKVMEWKSSNTLESLNNPVDIVEARANLIKIILQDTRFKKYISLQTDVLDKILFLGFDENLRIEEAIDLFIRKNTSLIASVRIDAVLILGKLANRPSYEPEVKHPAI